jgi:hypothetical protein
MTKPWPTVRLSEVLWNNENAEGVPEISRGLRRAATTPPDTRPNNLCTLKRCENGSDFLPRTILASLQGAGDFSFVFRGYRSAQPPANFSHPFRMPGRGSASRSTLAAHNASDLSTDSVADEAAAGHRPALRSRKVART